MHRLLAGTFVALLTMLLGLSALAQPATPSMEEMAGTPAASPMAGMGIDVDAPRVPPVTGYAEGEEIHFIHPEASDEQLAQALTQMMGGSPVLVVPALAEVPKSALAMVYAFTNGVVPEGAVGPLGFQPDVFDNPPGTEGYSPLRAVNLVTWDESATPRVLTSAAEVQAAVEQGELTIEETEIVVNMPFLTWPGGQR